jgi:monoterpene epsilon-lactone hydrolase
MSLALRLARGVMRHTIKPVFGRLSQVRVARAGLVLASLGLPLPFGVTARRDDLGGVGCLWLMPGEASGPVLFWLHGGAHVMGSAFTHRGMVGRIARASGMAAVLPEPRLAPEHPAPASYEDACAAFDGLVASGVPPERIVLGGDSAGGGLAAALLSRIEAMGARVAGVVLLSPWVDLTLSGASMHANAARDPMLPVQAFSAVVAQVRGALSPEDPHLSPLFAPFRGRCPVLITVGTTEVLLDDSLRLAARLRTAGAAVTLARLPGAPHVLAFFAPWIPEARAEIRRIGGFLRDLTA